MRSALSGVCASTSLGRRLAEHIKAHPPVDVTLPWRNPEGGRRITARLLFVREDGRPWHRQTYTFSWHKARRAAGAEETPEDFLEPAEDTSRVRSALDVTPGGTR
ncbi:hypothetical protein [Actinomadura rugatobispora]|uniref:Uncharacterized protein n=1 Tax=Actinomadura rugatobispora TaxID=1994 RepID=A0ABW0ZNY6_9ACTN